MSQLPRLRRHLGVSADVEDYLFYSHEGKSKGQPIGPRAVQDMLERILRRLDLPRTPDYARISVHKLRQGYALTCLRRGKSIYEVKKLLGHNSIETTMVYLAALSDRNIREELAARFPVTPELEQRIREIKKGGLKLLERIDQE